MRDLKRLVQVLKQIMCETEIKVSDFVCEYEEFYYIRKEHALLVFSTREAACTNSLIKSAVALIFFDKKYTSVVVHNEFNSEVYYLFSDTNFHFCSPDCIIHMKNISRDDYFNESLTSSFFIDYDDLDLFSSIKDIPCTININNL